MNMARFYTKWLQDMRDAQAEDGCYSNFAPNPWKGERFRGAPAWGDAGVIVAWRLYQNYADTGILEQHYESARRWVEFIRENNPDLVWRNERGNDYGDWLNADTLKLEGWPEEGAEVPKEVFATAFFAHSAQLLAKMASVLGQEDESSEYQDLAQGIREAFIREFVGRDGRIKGDTQAGYALALHFDLVPEELRAGAAEHMLRRIEVYGGRVSTGFHGTRAMMIELVRSGHIDAAYRLLNNRGVPSWRHMVEAGGTTIWERWDGYVEGRGFQDPGMNSFNHYAFGSVGEWIYRFMGGIGLDEEVPGYRKVVIQPLPGGGITHAKARYDSVNGVIESSWALEGGEFRLHLVVPPNAEAEVHVPTSDPSSVTEGGEPIAKSTDIELIRKEEGSVIVGVESGVFDFDSRIC
jgi:alpha-L-rhamnosidase